jgi:hypothetical protein
MPPRKPISRNVFAIAASPHTDYRKVVSITEGSLPCPPSPAKACGTYRTRSRMEDAAFVRWIGGARPAEIARELRCGLNLIDDAVRGNVTPIRRKQAA